MTSDSATRSASEVTSVGAALAEVTSVGAALASVGAALAAAPRVACGVSLAQASEPVRVYANAIEFIFFSECTNSLNSGMSGLRRTQAWWY